LFLDQIIVTTDYIIVVPFLNKVGFVYFSRQS